MKFLVLALCYAVAVESSDISPPGGKYSAAQQPPSPPEGNEGPPPPPPQARNGPPRPPLPPGCENAPNGTKLSDCCPNFPKFYSKEVIFQNCSRKCAPKAGTKPGENANPMCCGTDCAMELFGVLTDGAFDSAKAKTKLKELTAEYPGWTEELISTVVDVCANNATERVAQMLKGFNPGCTNKTTANMVIGQCIRRELFFMCPGMQKNEKCDALVSFGKGCPIFPFHDGCGGKGADGQQKNKNPNPNERQKDGKKDGKKADSKTDEKKDKNSRRGGGGGPSNDGSTDEKSRKQDDSAKQDKNKKDQGKSGGDASKNANNQSKNGGNSTSKSDSSKSNNKG